MNNDSNQKETLSREKWLEMAIGTMAHKCKSKFSLDSLLQEMLALRDHGRERPAPLRTADLRDRAEGAAMVAAVGVPG